MAKNVTAVELNENPKIVTQIVGLINAEPCRRRDLADMGDSAVVNGVAQDPLGKVQCHYPPERTSLRKV